MLSLPVVLEVRRLVAEGQLSHRAIAKQLGISRGMVHLIAEGRRGLNGRETTKAAQRAPLGKPGSSIPVRCPGCGGKVYLPCLLCKARARRSADAKRSFRAHVKRRTRAA
jgi:hypothetical protein